MFIKWQPPKGENEDLKCQPARVGTVHWHNRSFSVCEDIRNFCHRDGVCVTEALGDGWEKKHSLPGGAISSTVNQRVCGLWMETEVIFFKIEAVNWKVNWHKTVILGGKEHSSQICPMCILEVLLRQELNSDLITVHRLYAFSTSREGYWCSGFTNKQTSVRRFRAALLPFTTCMCS